MTAPNPIHPTLGPMERARLRMTFVGVTLMVLGVIALLAPIASTFVAAIVIGILLIAGGVLRLFQSFGDKRQNIVWLVLSSLLYVAAGVVVLWRPLLGTLSLTMLVGAFFVVGAISKAIHAYQYRGTHSSGWLLFDALISGILGIVLLAGLPTTAFWALGVIVGVDLMMAGVAWIALSSPRRTVSTR